jgi:hypothetical protein
VLYQQAPAPALGVDDASSRSTVVTVSPPQRLTHERCEPDVATGCQREASPLLLGNSLGENTLSQLLLNPKPPLSALVTHHLKIRILKEIVHALFPSIGSPG